MDKVESCDWTATGRALAALVSVKSRAPWSDATREIWPALRSQSAEAFADFLFGFALGRIDAHASGAIDFLSGLFKR